MVLGAETMVDFQAGEALNDIAGVVFILACVALLVNGRAARPDERIIGAGALIFAGAAAGLAAGTKLSFLAPVALLTLAVFAVSRGGRIRSTALFAAPMLLAGGYWYLRNLIVVGNPIPYTAFGPLGLPTPERAFELRPGFSVAHYWNDFEIWTDWFFPKLAEELGPLWPLVIAGLLVAGFYALRRGTDPLLRALGAVALLTGIAYLFTPLTAGGEEGEPIAFEWNIRYLAPAVAIGLAILPLLPAFSSTPRRRSVSLFALGGLALITTLSIVQWATGSQTKGAIATGVFVLALFGASAWAYQRDLIGPRAKRAGVVGIVAVSLLGAVVAGFLAQRHYFEGRYENLSPQLRIAEAVRWANDASDERIAISGVRGVFNQYTFAGPDLSNHVQWLGIEGEDKAFLRIPDCETWREEINAGGYTYVVTLYDPYNPSGLTDTKEALWTREDPGGFRGSQRWTGQHLQDRLRARSGRLRRPAGPLRGRAHRRIGEQRALREPAAARLGRDGEQVDMLGTVVAALLIVFASVVIGRALMLALGWKRPEWVAGAVGFAALVVIAPFAVRLPGRGLTAAIILGLLTLACAVVTRRATPKRAHSTLSTEHGAHSGTNAPRAQHTVALALVPLMLAFACLPFVFNEGTGVLGEGIYTNDQAAQLYWADWLADGFGPQPSAVSVGYPVGPQALAASVSEGTGFNLLDVFNGLLIAIPALTALAALSLLAHLSPLRRLLAAALTGLPYLGASFLAQSGFKETAMAMFVLALGVVLHLASHRGDEVREPPPARAAIGVIALLGAASVFTFSIPGGAWFAIAVPVWAILTLGFGTGRIDLARIRSDISQHRMLLIGAAIGLAGLAVIALGPAGSFLDKIDEVQGSIGRLTSPVFPGEAFGIWPEGDYRIVRGEVSGSLLATVFAGLCALGGTIALVRKREWGIVAVLVAAVFVYGLARPFAQIHVEAKALAVLAPVVMLVSARWLLAPGARPRSARSPSRGRRLLRAGAGLDLHCPSSRAGRVRRPRLRRPQGLGRADRRRVRRLPRGRPLRRLLAPRHPCREPGRLRATRRRRPPREDLAAGPRDGLRHAQPVEARPLRLRDHDGCGVCVRAAVELRTGGARG